MRAHTSPVSAVTSPARLTCYCASVRQAARAISQLYAEAIKPSELEQTHMTVLTLLRAKPEMTTGEVGQALAMNPSTITRTLRLMERLGLVSWSPGPDRREKRWRISPLGDERFEIALPLWRQAQARLRAAFGADDTERLRELSFRLASMLDSAEN